MQERAAAEAVDAARGFAEMFADDAPRGVLEHMRTRRAPDNAVSG
jgi:hypothetical protein